MNKNTGLALHLYTTKEELDNAKNGINIIVGWTKEQKPVNAYYHISVSMDICDILEKEVRVNVSKTKEQLDALRVIMGEAIDCLNEENKEFERRNYKLNNAVKEYQGIDIYNNNNYSISLINSENINYNLTNYSKIKMPIFDYMYFTKNSTVFEKGYLSTDKNNTGVEPLHKNFKAGMMDDLSLRNLIDHCYCECEDIYNSLIGLIMNKELINKFEMDQNSLFKKSDSTLFGIKVIPDDNQQKDLITIKNLRNNEIVGCYQDLRV